MTGKTLIMALAGVAGVALTAASAQAQTVTSGDGSFTAGINNQGEVFNYTPYTGLKRNADGYDPIAPGTPRDSWGVSTNLGIAYADEAYYGILNTVSVYSNYDPTGNATTVSVTTDTGLMVTQTFTFRQSNILADFVTLTNMTGHTLTDVKFQRNVDFDVDPTAFNENAFANAIPGASGVADSTSWGFENPDPTVAYTNSCAAGCNRTGDLGAGIKLSLGAIDAGKTTSFTYFYGANRLGESVDDLVAEVIADHANYWVANQSSENGAYPALGQNSAILAVEVAAVPEPSTWAMLGLGFAGLGFAGYRGRKSRPNVAVAAL